MAYPETISTVVILNVPAAFNMLWAIISPKFHPRMRRKINLFGSDWLTEFARGVGTTGLEVAVRAWHGGPCDYDIEMKSGAHENRCCRLAAGEAAEWSFTIAADGAKGGLHFSVYFIDDGSSTVSNVQAPDVKEGAVRGHYQADASGLLWLAWSNPSGWAVRAATCRVVGLQLGARAPTAAQACEG